MASPVFISGDLNSVIAPVDSSTIISRFDLLYLDGDDVKPLSSLPDLGSDILNQLAARDLFLGVALRSSGFGDTTPIPVATTGVFRFGCDSQVWELADLVAFQTTLINNVRGISSVNVAPTSNSGLAIGKVFKRESSSTETVQVQISSTLMGSSSLSSTQENTDETSVNAETDIGLIADDISSAAQNTLLLNTWLADNTSPRLTIKFSGKIFYFDGTIVIPYSSACIRLKGEGGAHSHLDQLLANTNRYSTIFIMVNGAISISGSGDSGSAVLSAISGYQLTADDRFSTFRLDSGTNALMESPDGHGYYESVSVNSGANTLILDRSCVSSGTSTNLVGKLKRSFIRVEGVGTSIDGIAFFGAYGTSRTPDTSPMCAIQCMPAYDGRLTGAGQTSIHNCGFFNFDCAILCGEGFAKWREYIHTYQGWQANNADHMDVRRCVSEFTDTFFSQRTEQSVDNLFERLELSLGVGVAFDLEKGGRFWAKGVAMTSGFSANTSSATLLRITDTQGKVNIDGADLDSPPLNVKYVDCRATDQVPRSEIEVSNVTLGWPGTNTSGDSYPTEEQAILVQVRYGHRVILRNVNLYRANAFGDQQPTIRLNHDGVSYVPYCGVYESLVGPDVDNPQTCVDTTNSSENAEVRIQACYVDPGALSNIRQKQSLGGLWQIGSGGTGTWGFREQ